MENKSPNALLYILLCLLCFIPALGLIVGILLLALGLYRRNGVILTLFCVLGMVFSLACTGYLVQKGTRKLMDKVNEGFRNVPITGLNETLRDIEFYKLVKGNYPDSLSQLTATGIGQWSDPTHFRISGKFYYQQTGDGHYTLFSKGYDGKPFTKDDVLPSLDDSLLVKTGFAYREALKDSLGTENK
jgi:hypothetical protein